MSTDVDPQAAGEVVAPAAADPVAKGVPTFEETTEEQMEAEASLWHTVFVSTLISVPVCVVIWLAIVALAIGGNSDVSWGVWLAIGAVVGVLAGVFFGGLFTFVTKSHMLDEADRHSAAAKHEHAVMHERAAGH